MPKVIAGIFQIDYNLINNAKHGADIQFGMEFKLTQLTESKLPLTQLIFPATKVGNNTPCKWNIDNHKSDSKNPECLIFPNADDGTIHDTPKELSKRNNGTLKTKFAVFRVDLEGKIVQKNGVSFGYTIDTTLTSPMTIFTGFKKFEISKEQEQIIHAKCGSVKFS